MKRLMGVILLAVLLCYGCNIVPKSVQYQKEEEGLIGSTDIVNPKVEEIQVILKNEGYETGNTDGDMGKETRDAIKAFQESLGIRSTGYIDDMTLTQLEELRRAREALEPKRSRAAASKTSTPLKAKAPGIKDALDTYSDAKPFTPTTKDIQTALKNAGFDPGPIDGKMGQKTRQAIKDFQAAKGLVADGVVGPKTWAELGKHM
ncbi:MAG: peptidoglycan-binding domain-containing protein [Candidatus Omnitrophota bacterium]